MLLKLLLKNHGYDLLLETLKVSPHFAKDANTTLLLLGTRSSWPKKFQIINNSMVL